MSPQRSILITGCSSGIGYDAAHTLARNSWRVFATCRDEADCERLRGEGLESLRLDHRDTDSIEAALLDILSRTGGTLDAVYCNAGYGLPVLAEDLPGDVLRDMMETNFFGVHEIVRRVIPVMRAQGGGRIVNCSSTLGLSAIRWRAPYVASKFALEGYTDTLRLELASDGIHAILIEPGPITSNFRLNAKAQFEAHIDWQASAKRSGYEDKILPRFERDIDAKDPFERPASAVTAKLMRALDARRPKPRYLVTAPTYVSYWARRLLPTRLADWFLAKA